MQINRGSHRKQSLRILINLLLDFEIKDKELLGYLVTSWKYRDIVGHSAMMNQIERGKKGAKAS